MYMYGNMCTCVHVIKSAVFQSGRTRMSLDLNEAKLQWGLDAYKLINENKKTVKKNERKASLRNMMYCRHRSIRRHRAFTNSQPKNVSNF